MGRGEKEEGSAAQGRILGREDATGLRKEGTDSLGRGGRQDEEGLVSASAFTCSSGFLGACQEIATSLQSSPGSVALPPDLRALGGGGDGECSVHKAVITLMFPKSHKVSRQRLSLIEVL